MLLFFHLPPSAFICCFAAFPLCCFATMLPLLTWLLYALPAYILWPVVFRLRYGHRAWVEPLIPRNSYQLTDFALGAALISYTLWLAIPWLSAGAPVAVNATAPAAAGLVVWFLGCALRAWAIKALGPNWRIGHDVHDPNHHFVARGPYRFYKHPINLALILVAIGQALITGFDARAIFLILAAAAYALIQNTREERFWRAKTRADHKSV
jgi:isoprenylcysteine carboxyl methyltransferase (ICMT) family protein YpbQ